MALRPASVANKREKLQPLKEDLGLISGRPLTEIENKQIAYDCHYDIILSQTVQNLSAIKKPK